MQEGGLGRGGGRGGGTRAQAHTAHVDGRIALPVGALNRPGPGRFQDARLHLEWAQHVAQSYPSAKMDVAAPEFHAWCIECAEAEARGGRNMCGGALDNCRRKWQDTNGRYLRMMAVRVMGCEWRVRKGRNSQKVTAQCFWVVNICRDSCAPVER